MTDTAPSLPRMRSWLFAPGDSDKKMGKAIASEADIALLDLEDSVTPENKADARLRVATAIAGAPDRSRVWVRVNPLSGDWTEADLDAVVAAGPGGIFLPKAEGGHDVERLDAMLSAREVAAGLDDGAIRIAALVTETAAAMFTTGTYDSAIDGQRRLVAMSWGAEDLSSELGAREQRGPDGEYTHVYEMARSLCLLGAVKAGVAPIETVQPEFRDLDKLTARARSVRAQGFRGMLAIHPAQVAPINEAFTPSAEELDHARAVIQAFADNPGAGTVSMDGNMLDRPHLVLAQRLLVEAGEP
ncbi:CoA ester lyase [Erythrobacter sp. F6033]|uniref:HpcH/HpaI aldolase/citrate lyase family protein n=1 Tax=Erythrobacter sp. F6033 TaxID=2926401 RepID=UPI001FF2BBD0|nr:CoA ester lyase [Erythrobacter sp. F6033]MCK0128742.1 CoA ester lyase [Erythrobacter sp. F6033]